MAKFQVVVGNVGTLYDGDNKAEANTAYNRYVRASKAGRGRAAGESVYLMVDGHAKAEHQGPADDEEVPASDRPTYRVHVFNADGSDSRTVYDGDSFLRSQALVTAIRTALVIAHGSGYIEVWIDDQRGPTIHVHNGAWHAVAAR